MARLSVRRLESVAELRRHASAWDDLWRRSEATLPTSRAALVALWCDHFLAGRPFAALVVEQDGQLVGALPLMQQRMRGLSVTSLPANQWSPGGDLLLDPAADVAEVCRELVSGADRLAWPLWWIDALPARAPRWQSLLTARVRSGRGQSLRRRYDIDLVEIDGNWAQYMASRSKNHRRHLRRSMDRATEKGGVALEHHQDLARDQMEPLLRTCFEIERSGWKGQGGSAVLNTPAAWKFYVSQAHQLGEWGDFRLTTLVHHERPIAFEYGWQSKGVYCSPKVGYDENLASLSPGQLLRWLLLERFHATREVATVDFLGPASPATSRWATHRYEIDRLLVSTAGFGSRTIVAAHRRLGPLLNRLLDRGEATSPPSSVPIQPIACPRVRVADLQSLDV